MDVHSLGHIGQRIADAYQDACLDTLQGPLTASSVAMRARARIDMSLAVIWHFLLASALRSVAQRRHAGCGI